MLIKRFSYASAALMAPYQKGMVMVRMLYYHIQIYSSYLPHDLKYPLLCTPLFSPHNNILP